MLGSRGLQAAPDVSLLSLHLPGIFSQTFLRVRANRQTRLNGESCSAPPSAPPPASSSLAARRPRLARLSSDSGPTGFFTVAAPGCVLIKVAFLSFPVCLVEIMVSSSCPNFSNGLEEPWGAISARE